jgi:hypothetical protein
VLVGLIAACTAQDVTSTETLGSVSQALSCATAYSQANCQTYVQGTVVSYSGSNWQCSNGNCANCATYASCAPGGSGCPWGTVWTSQGACGTSCTPSCSGKNCGSDGCGGSCGTCQSGYTCNGSGVCTANSSNNATAWKDCNLSGAWSASLAPGNYTLSQLQALGVLDNDMSSIQLASGYEAALFDLDNFGGTCVVAGTGSSCAGCMVNCSTNMNDKVSSVKIQTAGTGCPSSPTATAWKDCNLSGAWSASLTPGNYTLSQLQARGVLDNDMSSIQLPSGYEAALFDLDNFGGTCVVAGTGSSCAGCMVNCSTNMNDKVSSLKLQAAGTGCPSGGGLSANISSSQFYTIFPGAGSCSYWDGETNAQRTDGNYTNIPGFSGTCHGPRKAVYTYEGFTGVASTYGAFGSNSNVTLAKREIAAFLANVSHESDWLHANREYNTANYCYYCDPNWSFGCPAGQCQYYGRGPIQLSWNNNYKSCGDAIGVDLLNNPNLAADDPTIAMKTGVWYWMNGMGPGGYGANSHEAILASDGSGGFGATIYHINGGIECNHGCVAGSQCDIRVQRYKAICDYLGVSYGNNLTC